MLDDGEDIIRSDGKSGCGYRWNDRPWPRHYVLGSGRSGGQCCAGSARRLAEVEKTAAEIEALGRRSLRVTCDVLNRASIQALHDAVLSAFGKVDILVNAAGITLEESYLADRRGGLDAGYRNQSYWHFARLPGFLEKQWSRQATDASSIWASLSSFVGFHEVAAYSASKAGVASLTKVLAIELAEKGVNVNAIAPSASSPTPLNQSLVQGTQRGEELLLRTPMRRFGQAKANLPARQSSWPLRRRRSSPARLSPSTADLWRVA